MANTNPNLFIRCKDIGENPTGIQLCNICSVTKIEQGVSIITVDGKNYTQPNIDFEKFMEFMGEYEFTSPKREPIKVEPLNA